MMHNINIDDLLCCCYRGIGSNSKIAYILYPVGDMLENWIEHTAQKYGIAIVVITGMDWQNVFSPWPAIGVPHGNPDFKGESPEFLHKLRNIIIPKVETSLGVCNNPDRTLIGVSMSGLFALWQWIECDTFRNIASLSGSFWYEGFMEWVESKTIPHKDGIAFFLLGQQEASSNVKAFRSVGTNTTAIVNLLQNNGIKVRFESVPGKHYSNPIPRLEAAFSAIYS